MLAIAGAVSWIGYLLGVYGLSQLAGQNYSIGQLAIPGRFTLGTPAPDSGSGGSGGGGSVSPCTKAQIAAGYTTDALGNCNPPANPPPGGTKGSSVGWNTCINSKTGKSKLVLGKCPNGWIASGTPGKTGLL
jgi:hypothetical protein